MGRPSIFAGTALKRRRTLLGLALAVVIAGAGSAITLRARGKPAAAEATEERSPQETEAIAAEERASDAAAVVDLGDFLVNVRSANALRYLRIQVAVEVTPASGGSPRKPGASPPTLQLSPADLLRARDAVVTQLNASDFAALRTLEGQDELKRRIESALRGALPEYAIGEALFPAFAMQ